MPKKFGEIRLSESIAMKDDVSGKVDEIAVLLKNNTTEYTPTADYHPATKKYVDDNSGGAGGILDAAQYDPNAIEDILICGRYEI